MIAEIEDGTRVPGQRPSDDGLTGWLGVSRTPVREAIARLWRRNRQGRRPRQSEVPGWSLRSLLSQDTWMTFPLFSLVLGALVLVGGVLLLTPLGRQRRTVVTVAIVLLSAVVLAGLEIMALFLGVLSSSDWLPDQN